MNSIQLEQLMASVEPLYEKTWRASDDLLDALPHILADFKPGKILEFGPGLSSYILQHYCAAKPGTVYIGIDDINPYALQHQERLYRHGYAPTQTWLCRLGLKDDWYKVPDEEGLIALGPFDLILLDGPGEDNARACPRALALFEKLSDPKRTIWIVDDSSRPASGWLSGHWIPKRMGTYASTIIRDRNFNRTTTVIVPIN